MTPVYIIAARRTAVSPRNGAFRALHPHLLAAPVFSALLRDAGLPEDAVGSLVMGNALYGGGNPARMAGLAAGLGEQVPAMSIDTQCCSGMDAIAIAAQRVACGMDDVVIAGGLESWSRSPKRIKRALDGDVHDQEYTRPPFTPWPDRDPDMIEAAARLAEAFRIERSAQEAFAIESHRKARDLARKGAPDMVVVTGVSVDGFTRRLSERLCQKLPAHIGNPTFGLTSATIAVEADAAAAVLVVSEKMLQKIDPAVHRPVQFIHHTVCGSDPEHPALAPITATRTLLDEAGVGVEKLVTAEVMEAFAVQAMVCMREIGLTSEITNRGGGALARGHPVGASGAINVVRLWHELQSHQGKASGVAIIAAAGGLGSATLLRVT